MALDDLKLQKGQAVTADLLNRFADAVRRYKPVASVGITLAENADCTIVTADAQKASFLHPFACSLSGSGITIRSGLVNLMEPTVNKKALSDPECLPLPLQKSLYDSSGRSWICIRVEVDKTGVIAKKEGLQIIQSSAVSSGGGGDADVNGVGLHPIALITKEGRLFQITYFNLSHRYLATPTTSGATGVGRHLFWAS